MMRRPGPPAGQRTPAFCQEAAPTPPLLALIALPVLMVTLLAGEPSYADSQTHEAELDRAIGSIVKSFQTGKSDAIASLVPAECKAFIYLGALGDGGYYSRDQVYFMLNKVFSQNDTVDFRIRRQRMDDGGSAKRSDPPAFVIYIATWKWHRHDGVDAESQIHFRLSLKKGSWALAEIREAQ